jgi:hypothetical protein
MDTTEKAFKSNEQKQDAIAVEILTLLTSIKTCILLCLIALIPIATLSVLLLIKLRPFLKLVFDIDTGP